MSGWTARRHRHLLQLAVVPIVLLIAITGAASASTLGGVSTKTLFTRNVTAPAVVPRMRIADSFSSGTFTTGRVPQSRQYLTSTWNVVAGGWSIVSGVAVPQNGGTRIAIIDTGSANVLVAATLTRQATSRAGLIIRADTTGTTYLLAEFRNTAGGSVTLQTVVAGTATTVASATNIGTLTIVPLRIEATGSQISVRYNSTAVVSYTLTASEQAAFGALTSTGLWVSNASSETFDDFYTASWPAS